MEQASLPAIDWSTIAIRLDQEGHALVPKLFDPAQAKAYARSLADHTLRASRTNEPGCGHLVAVDGPLPEPLKSWQRELYTRLRPLADRWADLIGSGRRFPAQSPGWSAYVSRLGRDDYVGLHHTDPSADAFPLQLVMLFSEPGKDFSGGEFVMTERRPRMQSRPIVLPLQLGDAAIIPVANRPAQGVKGHYQATLKHAVSRVRSGERLGVELLFTDLKAQG